MTQQDRARWDDRYAAGEQPSEEPALPEHFAEFADVFIDATRAVEIACGQGRFATWLAVNGVEVVAYDVSAVAVERARARAVTADVADRCTFSVADLDDGLPAGDPVDLIVCNLFRDPRLDAALMNRLKPGGVLAIAALSEVGAEPGRFRARPGELTEAFAQLTMLGADEGDGVAWFVGERPAR